ncbi:aprataxin [Ophiocordyceps camponoti-floridani]|uniref:Aprataxin n=1 Tax=Ophiocordyceps camponoti-floridani TaxID=2030778 RepID=A0A8H4VCG2_9HYPO|nr:aprataxin [Ophiocordyceps camponoti-floridani]
MPPPTLKPSPLDPRMGLGTYITNPSSHPPSTVIYHDDNFVALRDRYPKATVHALLLPRDEELSLRHPLEALAHHDVRALFEAELPKLVRLVAMELRRVLSSGDYGQDAQGSPSTTEPPSTDPPPERDWSKEIITGVHANPSMRHLHIHVLSRDMHSPTLRHRKHYNSFTTPFLIRLDEFPEAAAQRAVRGRRLRDDLVCWRCGRAFGNRFASLKGHLEEEFGAWRRG